jgi:hypothetical protein
MNKRRKCLLVTLLPAARPINLHNLIPLSDNNGRCGSISRPVVIGNGTERPGFHSLEGQGYSLLHRVQTPVSLLSNGYPGLIPQK